MEDIRKLVPSLPHVQYLSLGNKIGAAATTGGSGRKGSGPSSNITEWIDLLSTLPDLSTLHGVKFFYEVPSEPPRSSGDHHHSVPMPMSTMERSRMRKNDEVAGLLAWKCKQLRWVDHWEYGSGKMIHLVRDHHGGGEDKVRWEVRRLRSKC
jgi:hypothetical protein